MRAKSPVERRILEVVDPIAGDLGFEVVRVRVSGGGKGQRLQIMAERADGSMSADDCAELSRAVSATLDVADPFSGAWELEVSSPGVDRPLTELAHFARWEGFEARLELDRDVEGQKRFRGLLAGVEEEGVLLDLPGEEDVTAVVPFAWIADAKLVLTNELLTESLKRRPADSSSELPSESAADATNDDEETA